MNEHTEYLLDRLEDEYDYECDQDVEKVDLTVVATRDTPRMIAGILKGETYRATQVHWRNGEHHYMLDGVGEVPTIFFTEVK